MHANEEKLILLIAINGPSFSSGDIALLSIYVLSAENNPEKRTCKRERKRRKAKTHLARRDRGTRVPDMEKEADREERARAGHGKLDATLQALLRQVNEELHVRPKAAVFFCCQSNAVKRIISKEITIPVDRHLRKAVSPLRT